MSEQNSHSQQTANGAPAALGTIPVHHGFWWKAWQVAKVVQARLRFVAILAVIGAVIGFWDTLSSYYEKWTRPLYGQDEVVDSDTEYFCPMHPYIVRDNRKEKCPICHMDLSRRKKGTGQPTALAGGTVSRVQLSPYRVVLAGVQTWPVQYEKLTKQIITVGSVEFDETRQAHVATRQKARIVKLFVNYTGQMVEKGEKLATLDVRYSPELMDSLQNLRRAQQTANREAEDMARKRLKLWDVGEEQIKEFLRTGSLGTELTLYAPINGHVIRKYQREGSFVEEGTPLYDLADLESVWIEGQVYEDNQALLREGLAARATTLGLPGQVFAGTLDFIYPHLDESSRTLAVRFHLPNPHHQLRPGAYATVTIDVPPGQIDALTHVLAADGAALRAVDAVGQAISSSGGAAVPSGLAPLLYVAGRQALLQQGWVLAVPDSAIIDTGSLKIVYRETAPDLFDGVEVQLGPRMAKPGDPLAYYPVLAGLQSGDRVVTNGSFLIDAETRLNPAVGSTYFGGSGGKSSPAATAVRPSTPDNAGQPASPGGR